MQACSSCEREKDESLDDKLSLERVDYSGNELRIDGYYYKNDPESPQISILFLYSNGIILYGGAFGIDETIKQEEKYMNGYHSTHAAKYKYYWGVFQINGSQIKYEKWVPVQGPLIAVTYEGVILNDTTFVITETYEMQNGQKKAPKEVYWEYHFKQFNPKPDNKNRFIP